VSPPNASLSDSGPPGLFPRWTVGGFSDQVGFLIALALLLFASSCAGPAHQTYSTTLPGVTDIYGFIRTQFVSVGVVGKNGLLWFAGDGLYQMSTDGTMKDVAVPDIGQIDGIAAGPDGSIWAGSSVNRSFDSSAGQPDQLVRVLPSGSIKKYAVPTKDGWPSGMAVDRNGNVWFSEEHAGRIGCRLADGSFREIKLPNTKSGPTDVSLADDGSLWFIERNSNAVGYLDRHRRLHEFRLSKGTADLMLESIATDTLGNAWVVEYAPRLVAMIDRRGHIRKYQAGEAWRIARGPDGAMWYTLTHSVGRITRRGVVTTFPSPRGAFNAIVAGRDGNIWFVVDLPSPPGFGSWHGIAKLTLPSH
jgi:virginiamycin B lyase